MASAALFLEPVASNFSRKSEGETNSTVNFFILTIEHSLACALLKAASAPCLWDLAHPLWGRSLQGWRFHAVLFILQT